MNREPVNSSNIKSVGYDIGEKVLEVEFHSGGVYQYDGVPPSVHGDFVAAPSVGQFFEQRIKGLFSYRKVSK